ncbi:sensor histidine kinase [Microbacterium hydrocarbonoxydans]|uniref:sensor histidine kinase n=1 Tax=Microbacterium hydrocarbonoxydans TaxID=273678 RepID=UPI0007BB74ED|nr:histidine kinase [Microbacterium hydrocarbonoxydans]GAT71650.1 signal transduction histidine kinase [Microbacterium sp. HM58-2]
MRPEPAPSPPGWRAWLRADTVVALAALVVLLPSSIALLTVEPTRPEDGVVALAVALFIALHLATLLAVRHPLVALGIASLAMLTLALTPGIQAVAGVLFPSAAAYLLVMAQVAMRIVGPLRIGALTSGVLGAGIIAFTEPRFDDGMLKIGSFIGLSAAVAAAWTIGLLIRLRRAQAEQRLQARVAQALSDERMRISRDLHDIVAHSMTVMIAQAEVARALRDDPARSDRALGVVIDTGREALRGMRTVVSDEAPREPLPTIGSLSALVEGVRTPSAEVRLVETGVRGRLRPDAAVALHHAVREALTNAVRHVAPPVTIEVRLTWGADRLHAVVADDGGAGPGRSELGSGTGLVGIAERVRLAGGTLTAAAREPRGWTVTVDLPVEGASA